MGREGSKISHKVSRIIWSAPLWKLRQSCLTVFGLFLYQNFREVFGLYSRGCVTLSLQRRKSDDLRRNGGGRRRLRVRCVDHGRSRDQVKAGEDEILQSENQTRNHSQVKIIFGKIWFWNAWEHAGENSLGEDSQNFLQKFVRFLVSLGLKILRLFRLKLSTFWSRYY
jgi:hypothetical protein